jgi:Flp pilus assembly protein TadG
MKGKKAMSFFGRAFNRGQSMVEFAMISALVFGLMMLGIQYALIGQAALAVSQGTSALARYVAGNPGALGTSNGSVKGSKLPAAAQEMLSPSIMTNGGNDLTVTVTSNTATGGTESGAIKPQSDQLIIALSYDATSKIVLPNPFMQVPPGCTGNKCLFPGITFPSTVGASNSQMYE